LVSGPYKLKVEDILSVPLASTVNEALAATVPLDTLLNTPPLLTRSVCDPVGAPMVKVPAPSESLIITTYVPARVIVAVSAAPGTWLGVQLPASFQLPPLVLFQVMVADRMGAALDKRKTNAKNQINGRSVSFIILVFSL
jgi:hypothetical protein